MGNIKCLLILLLFSAPTFGVKTTGAHAEDSVLDQPEVVPKADQNLTDVEDLVSDNKTVKALKLTLHRNDEFIHKLLEYYDSQVAPQRELNKPFPVEVSIWINHVDTIDASKQEFRLDIFLRQYWTDPRLTFNRTANNEKYINFNHNTIKRLWVPDLYFPNEKTSEIHDITMPNVMFHLNSDGTIFHSVRLALVLKCPMQLEAFPLDIQICKVQIESFNFPNTAMKLRWREGAAKNLETPQDVAQYSLLKVQDKQLIMNYKSTGINPLTYDRLQLELLLKRKIGFYIMETFAPSILVVMLSWVGFWINVDAVPARVSLGIITVLTICTQISSSRISQPRVNYLKAIDVWMTTCLLFVFAAFLEFAIVNVVWRQEVRRNIRKGSEAAHLHTGKAKAVDKTARMFFPLTFCIFMVCYWVVYLFLADRDLQKEGLKGIVETGLT